MHNRQSISARNKEGRQEWLIIPCKQTKGGTLRADAIACFRKVPVRLDHLGLNEIWQRGAEDPGLLSDTELHSHRRKNPVNVTVIYWIFHFPFSLCCLVFMGLMVSVHPWASPVLFCSRCRCAVSERNQIAFALTSSGLVSHLISLFKGGLEKNMRGKQQEMWFKNPDVFIAPCEKCNMIKPANNRAEKLTFWRKWKRFIIYQSLPIYPCTTKKTCD